METVDELIKAALDVREKAYAPFSEFRVGAAVRTKDGRIYSGCNVESASYGLTVCAERVAIWKAQHIGRYVSIYKSHATPDHGLRRRFSTAC